MRYAILSLALILTACGTTPVSINPTAASAATSAATALPPAAATAVSNAATAVASVTVPSSVQTAMATITVPPVTVGPVETVAPEIAAAVIKIYATQQLGLDVEILKAVGVEGELTLPASTQAEVRAALDLAGTSYGALLRGGVAVVALGNGNASGDIEGSIDWASLGVFSMRYNGVYPSDSASALTAIQTTFPALTTADFTPTAIDRGYAFNALGFTSAKDPATGETRDVMQVIIAGVLKPEQSDITIVYVIVGNGDLAAPLEP